MALPWTSPGQSHSTRGSFQLPAAEKHTSALQRPREGRQEEPGGSDVGNLEGCGSWGTTGYTPPTLTLQPGRRHQAALGRQVLAAPHSFHLSPGKATRATEHLTSPGGPENPEEAQGHPHLPAQPLSPAAAPSPPSLSGRGDGTTGRGAEGREGRQEREDVMRDFTTTTTLQKVRETWEVRPRASLPRVERTQALECPRHAFTFLLRHIAPCDLGEGRMLMSPSEPRFLHFTKQWPSTVPGAGRESDDPRLFRALRLPSRY